MSTWFEGSIDIACSLDDVQRSLADIGQHTVGVVERMPGMSTVELVDAASDAVTITTNEGVMRRTEITRRDADDGLVVELDETYEAKSKVTATSHVVEEFTATPDGVTHRLVISDVHAPGALGFLYRKLGSRNVGRGFLEVTKGHLEASPR